MASNFVLKSYEFRREREATWRRLEVLVGRVEARGLRSLSAAEIEEMPRLYRATLSSLSVARAISLDRALLEYLEALTQRAYFCVYGTKTHLIDTVVDFFVRGFPRGVRRAALEVLLAFAIMAVGTAVGYVLTVEQEDRFYTFVPEGLQQGRGPTASAEDLRATIYGGEDHAGGELAVFSAFLFQNNAGVGIMAFALGCLAGVPTAILMLTTGFMVGAFVAIHANRGLLPDIVGWLMIHGVTELLAVILCGAAGFAVARALLAPGRFRRLDALRLRGREAGVIVLGCVAMFFVAGIIEGVFRQTIQSMSGRYVFAATTAVLWGAYFVFCGRGRGR